MPEMPCTVYQISCLYVHWYASAYIGKRPFYGRTNGTEEVFFLKIFRDFKNLKQKNRKKKFSISIYHIFKLQ